MLSRLISVSVGGQGAAFLCTLVAARAMTPVEFEVYAATAALFLLMLKIVPLGTDRLGLLMAGWAPSGVSDIPAYLRFALRRLILGWIIMVALLVAGFSWAGFSGDFAAALLIATIALPFAALCRILSDLLAGKGWPLSGAVAVKLAVPATALLIMLLGWARGPVPAFVGIAAWTLGWLLASMALIAVVRRTIPSGAQLSHVNGQDWSDAAANLWLAKLIGAFGSQIGLFALVVANAPAEEVGAFVAAQAVVALVLTLGLVPDRIHARSMAIHLAAANNDDLRGLSRQRLRWLLTWIGPPLVLTGFAAPTLVDLVNPGAAASGAVALRLLLIACAAVLIAGLSAGYLVLRGKGSWLIRACAVSLAGQVLLLCFSARLGANTAAWAAAGQGLPLFLLSLALFWKASRTEQP